MSSTLKFSSIQTYSSTEFVWGNEKIYKQVFNRWKVDYIYTEVQCYNKLFDSADQVVSFKLCCYKIISGQKDQLVCELDIDKEVSKNDEKIIIREGWGAKELGAYWKKGKYRWDVHYENDKIGNKLFYINDFMIKDREYLPFEVEMVRLYEGPYDDVLEENRKYLTEFNSSETRYIYGEFTILNKAIDFDWEAEFICSYFFSTRELKGKVLRRLTIPKGQEKILITVGWGAANPNLWREGRYTFEVVYDDSLILSIPLYVGSKFKYNDRPKFTNYTIDNADTYTLLRLPKQLRTGFQQYLLFFREYVEIAKDKSIEFEIKIVDEGLEIMISEDITPGTKWHEYFEEYLSFARENIIGVMNVEGNPDPHDIDLLRLRLEQQVNNLNTELKFKNMQISMLEDGNRQANDEKKFLFRMLERQTQNAKISPARSLSTNSHLDQETINKNVLIKMLEKSDYQSLNSNLMHLIIANDQEAIKNDLHIIKSRLSFINRERMKGTISFSQYSKEINDVNNSYLVLIDLIY